MATAIIGLGNIGTQVSLNLMAGCQQVIVADHGLTKAMELANGSVGKARALSLADAVETVAIIIFAVYFDASKGLLAQYRDWLVGQIVVVDPSNPIALDGSGGFKKLIPPGSIVGTDPRRTASARGQVRQSLRDTCGAILEDGCSSFPLVRRQDRAEVAELTKEPIVQLVYSHTRLAAAGSE